MPCNQVPVINLPWMMCPYFQLQQKVAMKVIQWISLFCNWTSSFQPLIRMTLILHVSWTPLNASLAQQLNIIFLLDQHHSVLYSLWHIFFIFSHATRLGCDFLADSDRHSFLSWKVTLLDTQTKVLGENLIKISYYPVWRGNTQLAWHC